MKKHIVFSLVVSSILLLVGCGDDQLKNNVQIENKVEKLNSEFGLKETSVENDVNQKEEESQNNNDQEEQQETVTTHNSNIDNNENTMEENSVHVDNINSQSSNTIDTTIQKKSGCQVYNPITGGCED